MILVRIFLTRSLKLKLILTQRLVAVMDNITNIAKLITILLVIINSTYNPVKVD